jgi:hypothetical protein
MVAVHQPTVKRTMQAVASAIKRRGFEVGIRLMRFSLVRWALMA